MVTKIKKILGILLGVCFLMSVTAATVSAKPPVIISQDKKIDDKKVDKNVKKDYKNVKKDDKKVKKNDKNYGKKHTKGHWIFKKTRHDKDRNHKYVWYTYVKCWHWDD